LKIVEIETFPDSHWETYFLINLLEINEVNDLHQILDEGDTCFPGQLVSRGVMKEASCTIQAE